MSPGTSPSPASPAATSMTPSLQSMTRVKVWLKISMSWRSSWSLALRWTERQAVRTLWRPHLLLCSSRDNFPCGRVVGGGKGAGVGLGLPLVPGGAAEQGQPQPGGG